MKTKRDPIVLIVAAILIAGVGFVGGMQVQKGLGSKSASATTGTPGGYGTGGPGGGFRHNGTFGTVSSINGTTSMVVQDSRTGTSVTVSLTGNPTVTDGSGNSSSVSAIATGDTVIVMGSTGSDGTVAATSIRLNPTFGGGAPGGSSSSSGTATQ
jgi:hypothetical protein